MQRTFPVKSHTQTTTMMINENVQLRVNGAMPVHKKVTSPVLHFVRRQQNEVAQCEESTTMNRVTVVKTR